MRRGVVLGRASLQDTGVEDRERRIVDTAMGLAQSGGFEAVRMRDVAAQSGCALATLYRHFPSKDELLLAALRREAQGLERRMRRRAPEGGRAVDRLTAHFDAATRALFRRPWLAREILRAAMSDAALWRKVRAFDTVAGDLAIAALRGDPDASLADATAAEREVCQVLYQVWFSALIARVSGHCGAAGVSQRVRTAARLVLRGADVG